MDLWESYSVELNGGLVTNLSPLQQGINAPGSARSLINFEPSIEGGYSRIKGYAKYDDDIVQPYGTAVVHGASQSGTSLVVAGLFTEPEVGDVFTVAGITGTYTITSVSWSSSTFRATLGINTLDSSPANGAVLTFTSTASSHVINGIFAWETTAISSRNGALWQSSGSGHTMLSVPNLGTILVDGGSQTGTTLVADGFDVFPQTGDTFTIAGIDLVYSVTADVTSYSDTATKEVNISITPALASSPADNAVITMISSKLSNPSRTRFARFNTSGTEGFIGVNGSDLPFQYDGTNFQFLPSAPTNVEGAKFVIRYNNTMFFGKDDILSFTAPYTHNDFTAANGAGEIRVGADITGLAVFRTSLIVFTEDRIFRVSGTSQANYDMDELTQDIGCIHEDTIQEVGSDVLFLASDGLRLVSATEQNQAFNFDNVSKNVQSLLDFQSLFPSFSSCVVRKKSQYRLFGYSPNISADSSKGIVHTQLSPTTPDDDGVAFCELRGFKAYVSHSELDNGVETALFANDDGYIYEMESGNSLDGANIVAEIALPHWPVTEDPRLRKTFHKLHIYSDPTGSFNFTVALKLDFDSANVLQPSDIEVTNATVAAQSFYGTAVYGVSTFGEKTINIHTVNLVGAGFTGSFVISSEGTDPPFSLDALVLEYSADDRR